jgi:hypothetical protein
MLSEWASPVVPPRLPRLAVRVKDWRAPPVALIGKRCAQHQAQAVEQIDALVGRDVLPWC